MNGPRLPAPARLVLAAAAMALGLAALALPGLAEEAGLWYASDAAAFQGEAIAGPSAADYSLFVKLEGPVETRVLYRKGSEISRLVTTFTASGRAESQWRGAALSEERRYDAAGNLVLERFYELAPVQGNPGKAVGAAGLKSSRSYFYAGNRLLRVESHDSAGALSGTMGYRYDPSGRLVELTTTGDFGLSQAGLAQGTSLPSATWSSTPLGPDLSLVDVTSYDSSGRPVEKSSWKEAVRLAQTTYTYSPNGLLVSRKDLDLALQESTETRFDQEGRAILVERRREGRELSLESLAYDDKGRLLSDEVRSATGLVKTVLTYEGEGEESRATTTENGLLSLVVVTRSDGTMVRELYDRGRLFLKAYYADGRLRKEEFMDGALVLRSREYP